MSFDALGSDLLDRRCHTWDRCLGRPPARRAGLWDTEIHGFHRFVRVVRPVVVSGSMTQRRLDWTSTG